MQDVSQLCLVIIERGNSVDLCPWRLIRIFRASFVVQSSICLGTVQATKHDILVYIPQSIHHIWMDVIAAVLVFIRKLIQHFCTQESSSFIVKFGTPFLG